MAALGRMLQGERRKNCVLARELARLGELTNGPYRNSPIMAISLSRRERVGVRRRDACALPRGRRLPRQPAAIHGQHGAVNVIRRSRRKEYGGSAQIGRTAPTPSRNAPENVAIPLLV